MSGDDRVGLDQLDADGEPPEFDLTPREPRPSDSGARGGRNRRRWIAAVVLLVVVAAAAFLVTKALGSATDYFYQADQAVAHRSDLGTQRFRVQGTVANTPSAAKLTENSQKIEFQLAANGVTVPVIYTGSDPPALFARCEPVVIVGHWQSKADDAPFIGTQIIIKHTESYTAEHADRMKSDPECRVTPS
ncbi:MAG: cytochrome c maturation protein CcmE [Actinobacteria bacterium]|nr:cytochrome c maturation protein CcmE [Actinomycetota bacterium]